MFKPQLDSVDVDLRAPFSWIICDMGLKHAGSCSAEVLSRRSSPPPRVADGKIGHLIEWVGHYYMTLPNPDFFRRPYSHGTAGGTRKGSFPKFIKRSKVSNYTTAGLVAKCIIKFLHCLYSTGSKWKSRRRLLTPAFHYHILKDYIPIYSKQSSILISLLKVRIYQFPW